MPNLVLNAIGSLAFGIVTGLITAFFFEWIKQRRWWRLAIVCGGLTAFAFLLLVFFAHPNGRVQITEIDGQSPAAASSSSVTGYRVEVRGSLTDSSEPIYIVVKPTNSRFWYIQPPASFIGSGTTDWSGQAYLGTPSAGVGDSFVVFAIATSDKHVAETQLNKEPVGLKSNAVLLKRSR